jgi:hypothetical protein
MTQFEAGRRERFSVWLDLENTEGGPAAALGNVAIFVDGEALVESLHPLHLSAVMSGFRSLVAAGPQWPPAATLPGLDAFLLARASIFFSDGCRSRVEQGVQSRQYHLCRVATLDPLFDSGADAYLFENQALGLARLVFSRGGRLGVREVELQVGEVGAVLVTCADWYQKQFEG